MFKLLNKKKNNKGFTLVELVIVVAILAILVGILAPQYIKYVEKSRKAADASNIENVVKTIQVASADEDFELPAGTYTVKLNDDGLEVTGPNTALTAADGDGALTKALIEYMGNDTTATYAAGSAKYINTKIKSHKWGANNATGTEITAEATVTDTGSVTIKYTPDAFQKYVGVK